MQVIKRPWNFQVVTNSPEGIHQDGMDFIVPALIIDRVNIQGGQSLVYDARGVPLRENGYPDFIEQSPNSRVLLPPGHGMLHPDRGSLFGTKLPRLNFRTTQERDIALLLELIFK